MLGELGRHPAYEVATLDLLGFEGVAEHADDGVHVDMLAAGEEIGGHVTELGPGVEREMALGDHCDGRNPMRRELMHEHVDERDLARGGRGAQRPFGDLDRVEVLGAPELADRVPTDPSCVQLSPPPQDAKAPRYKRLGDLGAPGR